MKMYYYLQKFVDILKISDFSVINLKTLFTDFVLNNHLDRKDFSQAIRLTVSGKLIGVDLFDMLSIIGKDKTILRLERAINVAKESE